MKINNIRDLQNHLKNENPDFEIIEKPSTSGKTKLLQYAKRHNSIIVVAGDNP